MTWLLSHGKYKCVLSHPIPWEDSHGNPIPMDKPVYLSISQQPAILYGTAALTCKLLCLLLDRHMVSLIMKLVHNQSFTLTTGTGKQSRLWCLKDQSWFPSCLISLHITYQWQFAGNLLTLMTWLSCTMQVTGKH